MSTPHTLTKASKSHPGSSLVYCFLASDIFGTEGTEKETISHLLGQTFSAPSIGAAYGKDYNIFFYLFVSKG